VSELVPLQCLVAKQQSWSTHQGTDDSWMRKDAITEQMQKNAFLSKFLAK
jgi:hypothetical protein